ncbi:hypothetical protein M0802_016228 [Mischocyttarus mexicanus]|nr:hypothetical protein M0802_016228 [Mischocyttarus mexicanus]
MWTRMRMRVWGGMGMGMGMGVGMGVSTDAGPYGVVRNLTSRILPKVINGSCVYYDYLRSKGWMRVVMPWIKMNSRLDPLLFDPYQSSLIK